VKVGDLIERLQQLLPEGDVRLTERDLSRLFGRLEAERIAREEEGLWIRREFAAYSQRHGVSLARAAAEMLLRMLSKAHGFSDGDWDRLKRDLSEQLSSLEAAGERDIAKVGGEEAWIANGESFKSTPEGIAWLKEILEVAYADRV